MKLFRTTGLLLGALITLGGTAAVEARTWTDTKGRTIEADFIKMNGDKVVVKRNNGKTVSIPLNSLSQKDKDFLAQQTKKESSAGKSWENYDDPWPDMVRFEGDYEVEEIKAEKGEYIYETPHFRFICDAKIGTNCVKQLARMFEATHMANKTLPLGNAPAHDDAAKFPAYLYENYETYRAQGGMEGSAGIFIGSSRPGDRGKVLVPFRSLGVKKTGSTYVMDRKQEPTTLIHEITHQMMTFQAKQAAWFCEASAEYVANTPYTNTGTFKFSSNKKNIVEKVTAFGKKGTGGRGLGKNIKAPNLEQYMNMPYDQFVSNNPQLHYGLALLMGYYFYHMDGEGDAARIKAYLKAIQSGKSEKEAQKLLLDGRTYDQLAEEIEKAWRSSGVKLKFEIP